MRQHRSGALGVLAGLLLGAGAPALAQDLTIVVDKRSVDKRGK